jgi:hypothetical protein
MWLPLYQNCMKLHNFVTPDWPFFSQILLSAFLCWQFLCSCLSCGWWMTSIQQPLCMESARVGVRSCFHVGEQKVFKTNPRDKLWGHIMHTRKIRFLNKNLSFQFIPMWAKGYQQPHSWSQFSKNLSKSGNFLNGKPSFGGRYVVLNTNIELSYLRNVNGEVKQTLHSNRK